MSITAIIGLFIAAVAALFGGFAGHSIGKARRKTEGAMQAKVEQASIQNEQAAQSAKDRTHVEVQVAADTDDDLERRLQKHDRVG